MEFKNYTSFVNGVRENDLQMVKSQLAEMIMLFQGEKAKIMEAVEYAKNNSSFKFENHLETTTAMDKTSNSDMFYTEISELQTNFSKERFLEVIRLYPLMVEQDNFFNKGNDKNEIDSEVEKSSKITKTQLLIGAGVIIGGIILYKFLK
ncbi:hypothetical protein [Aequorivita sinensis]|uniref:hypothetical protein n=1 Tax=Aequorivita sinensis TaxID=1382458 RepID=UPI00111C9B88|nr:hypothetical protein [Aequorivita sinensis]